MPDNNRPTLGLATAGQLRRAGFDIEPETTDDSATTGFEVLSDHTDEHSRPEFETAKTRGDHMPKAVIRPRP